MNGSGLVRGIRRPAKVRDGDSLSQLLAILKDFFQRIEDVRSGAMERDASDVDGGGGGKVDAFDRGTWSKFDDITCRDSVTDDVELSIIEAVRLKDFVDLDYMGLVGGEKA